ncbi:MAG TPA: GerMN domain-containing protein [Gryllotalpicola sp.]
MRLRRRIVAVVAAVLAASVLAGCATIPRTGPVTRGGPISAQDDSFGQIDYHPSGPVAGEAQDQVLRGFIDAAVSPENGYQIAREFLADSFKSQWNPDASVTVDQEAQRDDPSRVNSTQLALDVTPVAFVDQAGNYSAANSQAPVPLGYSFVKQGGQWRISKAPDGIVMDAARFPSVFSPHALYFYSPDFHYLVPDERWFPSSRTSIATRIVKALLDGPSAWLQDAVATAFPKGTQLTSGSVVVQNGAAQVALNSVAGGADQSTLDRMGEQLSESLTTTASVSTIALTIGGVVQDASGTSGAQHDPTVNASPIVYQDGKFGYLTGKDVVDLDGIGAKVAALHPRAVTVSSGASAAAVLTSGGVYAVADSADDPVRVDKRAGLLAPSIDSRGIVWSAVSAAGQPFAVSAADGTTTTLTAAWPDARALVAFAISRDGSRLAALVRTTDGQSHLMVAGIVRDADGHASRIGEPLDLGNLGLSEGLALAWTDELSIAVLGTSPQGGTEIVTQELGGTVTTTPGPPNGVAIAGGNPSSQDWVLDSGGTLSFATPAGNAWQTALTGVGLLATQQGRG